MALHRETLPEQLLECLIIIIFGPSDVGLPWGNDRWARAQQQEAHRLHCIVQQANLQG